MMGAVLQLLGVVAPSALYVVGVRRLAGTPKAVPGWRQASFYGGLALAGGSLVALGTLPDELFLAHMAEHLLIADLAALLLVVGLTGPLLAPVLRVRPLDRLRVLTHPAVALPLWALNLYLWHIPLLHEAAVRDDVVHAVQHGTFIGFGAAVWMPLFGPLPKPVWFSNAWKLGYIVAVRLTGAVLGNVLAWSGGTFYDVYRAGERAHGVTPQQDQNVAGAIMMVEGSILTIVLFGWLFLRSARENEERQELLDFAGREGVELSDGRATRAVTSGRGAELRQRIADGRLATGPDRGTEES